jgi:ABC-2 type transport system permease protein
MSALVPLTVTEARLLSREWGVMLFGFVFPPLMMLVLAGVFASGPDPAYGGATGTDYYITSYIGIPIGALTLVGLPVMLASYRERGVLRRYEAFGVSTATVVAAHAGVTCVMVLLGAALDVATAAPVYGVPAVHRPLEVAVGFAAGMTTMVLLGITIGLAVSTARAAQAVGMLAFMPMWILGGGGPPREAMTSVMQDVSDLMPLWHVTSAIRTPWLGDGAVTGNLAALAVWGLGAALCAVLLLRRRPR